MDEFSHTYFREWQGYILRQIPCRREIWSHFETPFILHLKNGDRKGQLPIPMDFSFLLSTPSKVSIAFFIVFDDSFINIMLSQLIKNEAKVLVD